MHNNETQRYRSINRQQSVTRRFFPLRRRAHAARIARCWGMRTDGDGKAKRPRRVAVPSSPRPGLRPRLTLSVDGHGRSGRSDHLHAMILTSEIIGDVPMVRSALAGRAGAALNFLVTYLLPATATYVRAHCGSRHRADRRDVRLVQSLVVAPTVVVDRDRHRRIAIVVDARVRAHGPHRRNTVVQAHRGQRRIPARTQDDATRAADASPSAGRVADVDLRINPSPCRCTE